MEIIAQPQFPGSARSGWADLDGDGVVDINDFNAAGKPVGTRL
jgi:hypothetical protein